MDMNVKLKKVVDILMTAVLLFLMGYQFWGEKAHEWAGMGIFVLFIAHHILNLNWYKNLFHGRYPPVRIFQVGGNMFTLLSVLVLMYSSVILSRYVFAFLPIESGRALARRLHMLGAHWGFLLMSMHLGSHWNMVLAMLKRKCKAAHRSLEIFCFILGLAVALYGVWVFVKRDFFIYMFLQSEFVFLDYEESKIRFCFDYLSLMGACIFISHFMGKFLRDTCRKGSS